MLAIDIRLASACVYFDQRATQQTLSGAQQMNSSALLTMNKVALVAMENDVAESVSIVAGKFVHHMTS